MNITDQEYRLLLQDNKRLREDNDRLRDALKEAEFLYSSAQLLARTEKCGKWINKTREALAADQEMQNVLTKEIKE